MPPKLNWTLKCECGWQKDYRNPVAAQMGGERHLPYCPFYLSAQKICDKKFREERENMGVKTFDGKTEDAGGFILSASFWKSGTLIRGRVIRHFETDNGRCHVLLLEKPITVDGQNVSPKQPSPVTSDRFSIGGLTGFQMALDASHCGELMVNDVLTIKATGETETGKGNAQINFRVRVERGDNAQQEAPF